MPSDTPVSTGNFAVDKLTALSENLPTRKTALDRVIEARQPASIRLEQRIAESSQHLQQQKDINEQKQQQNVGWVPNLFGDSDIANTLGNSAIKGAASAFLEGPGYLAEKAGFEVIGSALQNAGERVHEAADKDLGLRSVVTQGVIAGSQLTGDITDPGTWDTGESPNASGLRYQMLGVLGEFAPQAAGLIAKGVPGLLISGAVGASQAGISQGKEAEKFINAMTEDELKESSTLYNDLLSENSEMSHEEARKQVAATAKAAAFTTGAIIGGAGGVATNYILKPLQGSLSKSLAGRIGQSSLISGVEEGAQEVGETVASRLAANAAAGTQRDATEGTFGDAVLGGTFGTGIGGVAGTATGVNESIKAKVIQDAQQEASEKQNSKDIAITVNTGDIKEVLDLNNRDKYSNKKVSQALHKVLIEDVYSPEEKEKAEAGIVSLEKEIEEEIEFEKAVIDDPNGYFNYQISNQEKVISGREEINDRLKEKDSSDPRISENEVKIETAKSNIEDIKKEQSSFSVKDSQKRISELTQELTDISDSRTFRNSVNESVSKQSDDVSVALDNAITNSSSISDKDLANIGKDSESLLSPAQASTARKLHELRQEENASKSFTGVQNEIYSNNQKNGYLSIQDYRTKIGAAVKSGDGEAAQLSLRSLARFAKDHKSKADRVNEAFNLAKETGKQQVVYKDNKNGWSTRPRRPIDTDALIRKNGGLSIHRGSGNLSSSLLSESSVLQKSYDILQEFVENKTAIEVERADKNKSQTKNSDKNPVSNNFNHSDSSIVSSDTDDGTASKKAEIGTEKKVAQIGSNTSQAPETQKLENNEDKSKASVNSLINLVDEKAPFVEVMRWAFRNGTKTQKALLTKYAANEKINSLEPVEAFVRNGGDKGGVYYPRLNKIKFDLSNESSPEFLTEAIIHELTHVITFDQIENDSDFREEVTKTIDYVAGWVSKPENAEQIESIDRLSYAISTPQEFLATVLGSEALQKDLAKIPTKGKNVLSDVMQMIVDSVKNVLGLSQADTTVLNRTLNLVEKALDPVQEPVQESHIADDFFDNAVPDYADIDSDIDQDIQSFLDSEPVVEVAQETEEDTFGDSTDYDQIDVSENTEGQMSFQKSNEESISGPMNQEQMESINKLNAYFTGSNTTPLTKYNNFIQGLLGKARTDLTVLNEVIEVEKYAGEKELKAKKHLREFFDNRNRISTSVDLLHNPNNPKFRWQTPLDYFMGPDGYIDSVVKDAIAFGVFNFMAQNGNNLWDNYTESQQRAVLAIGEDDIITSEQQNIARTLGRRQNALNISIGKDIYKALGLQINNDAPANEETQIVGALGSMATAVMMDMGLVQRQTFKGIEIDSNAMILQDKVNAGITISKQESNYLEASRKQQHHFLRSARIKKGDEYVDNPVLTAFSEAAKGTAGLLNEIFSVERKSRLPVTDIKEASNKQTKAHNSQNGVPTYQQDLVDQVNKRPYYLKTELLDPVNGIVNRIGETTFKAIAGFVDTDNSKNHIDALVGIEGKNSSITREYSLVNEHVQEVLDNDISKPFYILNDVKKNGRTFLDSGGINPLTSKLHRSLVYKDGWEYEINLESGENLDQFKLSVMESMGIAIDGATKETVLKEFEPLAQSEHVQAALPILKQMLNDSTYIPSDAENSVLINSSKEGGEDTHSFLGLLALAKYSDAVEKGISFKSDLFMEGDGKTNGPMFALLQLAMNDDVSDKHTMSMGGFYTTDSVFSNYGEYAERANLDLYKVIAQDVITITNEKMKKGGVASRVQASIVQELMGNMTEVDNISGKKYITKKGRKLVKGPITQTAYGAGVDKTIASLGDDFFDTFTGYLGKNYGNAEKINNLIRLINRLLPEKEKIRVNKKADYLNHKFTPVQKAVIKAAITQTFGDGIKKSLKRRFSKLTKVRNHLSNVNNMSVRMYKNAYEARKREIVANSIKDGVATPTRRGKQPYISELSKKQMNLLNAEMENMFPSIHTYMSKQSGELGSAMTITKEVAVGESEIGGMLGGSRYNNLRYLDKDGKIQSVKSQSYRGQLKKIVEPGVSATVNLTHSMDSSVQIGVTAGNNTVNVHDAAIGAAHTLPDVMKQYNENTFKIMNEFSQIEESLATFYRIHDEYSRFRKDYKDDLLFQEGDAYIAPEIRKWKEGQLIKSVSNKTPLEHIKNMLPVLQDAHTNKLKYMSQLKVVDQYYVAGGVYKVSQEQRDVLSKRANEEKLIDLINTRRTSENVVADSPVVNQEASNISLTNQELDAALIEEFKQIDDTFDDVENNALYSPTEPSPKDYSTSEIFTALSTGSNMSYENSSRIGNLLINLSEKMYGPMGATGLSIQSKAGETVNELAARNIQEGIRPVSSRAIANGISLNDAEQFALEQIETVVKASLDGGSISDKEILKAFRDARTRINPSDFYNGDYSKATANEIEQAEKTYDFIFKLDGDKRTNHVSRFVALGLVYSPLREALNYTSNEEVKLTKSKKIGDIIHNIFEIILQKISNRVNDSYVNQKADSRLTNLVTALVHNEHKRRLELNSKKANIEEKMEALSKAASDTVRKAVSVAGRSSIFQREGNHAAIKSIGLGASIIAEDRIGLIFDYLESERNKAHKHTQQGFMLSVLSEVKGETEETRKLHTILGQANKIQQERKRLADTLADDVLNSFNDSENISTESKAAITQLYLRNDLSSLMNDYSFDEINRLVMEPAFRASEITKLSDDIQNSNTYGGDYLKSSHDLAYFLATGKNVSPHLLKNANNIAHQYSLPNEANINNKDASIVTPKIDKLVSLLAIKYSDQKHFDNIRSIVASEQSRGNQSGLQHVLYMHKRLADEANKDLFDGNPIQMAKGYTKEIYDPYQTVVAATEAEGERLVQDGYERIHDIAKDRDDPELNNPKSLYVLRGVGMQGRQTGAVSYTSGKTKGSTINDFVNVKDVQTSKLKKVKKLKKFNSDYDPGTEAHNQLVPVLDTKGKVINYQYMMSHNNKDSILKRNNDFHSILGSIAGNQYDKLNSKEHNETLVVALKEFYLENKNGDTSGFVNFAPDSKDPELAESYVLLPESTKRFIRETWGRDGMAIRNDLLNMLVGYKNLSITDPFSKDSNARNVAEDVLVHVASIMLGRKAAVRLRRAEDIWKEAVKLFKDIVVIRNISTLIGNVTSNTISLVWQGVPVKDIAKGHKEAIDGLIRYQEAQTKLVKLRNRVGTTGSQTGEDRLTQEIRETVFELKRNPVDHLVDAGLFQTIQEDVDVQGSEGPFKSDLDKFVSKGVDKLPEPVRRAGEFLAVNPNTPLYKILSKSTQMSDFVARYVLYDHLTKRNSDPITDEEAISKVREAFVNYDVNSNKFLQYGNDTGLVVFTKYYLRTQKVLLNLMKEKPARALGIILTEHYLKDLPTIMDSSAFTRGLGNPIDNGAFSLLSVLDEPLPIKTLFNLFD